MFYFDQNLILTIKTNKMKKSIATQLDEMFLDFFSNYLTIHKFAEVYGLTENEANVIIDAGRKIHENKSNKK